MRSERRIVIPPYVGEFGWELMNWQARVRRVVRESRDAAITLGVAAGHEPLYEDLFAEAHVQAASVAIHDIHGQPSEDHRIDTDGLRLDAARLKETVIAAMVRAQVEIDGANILWPDFCGRLLSTDPAQQQFLRFGRTAKSEIDVLLVPRVRASAYERNQSQEWWHSLATRLQTSGLRVDFYAPPLSNAIAQLRAARLAAGGSTGGLHLASLCGCPHVVWGPGRAERWTSIQMSNRQRYETIWNPLGTRVRYAELGWRPTVEQAASAVRHAFDSIAVGISSPGAISFDRFRWRARRGLAGLWARGAAEGRTPWRVRELLREATS